MPACNLDHSTMKNHEHAKGSVRIAVSRTESVYYQSPLRKAAAAKPQHTHPAEVRHGVDDSIPHVHERRWVRDKAEVLAAHGEGEL